MEEELWVEIDLYIVKRFPTLLSEREESILFLPLQLYSQKEGHGIRPGIQNYLSAQWHEKCNQSGPRGYHHG